MEYFGRSAGDLSSIAFIDLICLLLIFNFYFSHFSLIYLAIPYQETTPLEVK